LSPPNGFTVFVKAPWSSVTTEAATCVETSQNSVMVSFLRKSWPVAVMLVLAGPVVGCRPMLAPLGRGAYTVAAGPVALRELVAVTVKV
jgi:hypothetical protein